MADRVFVDNLRLLCRVGLTAKEREEEQEVIIDASLFLDLSRAGRSDRVEESVDYKDAMQVIAHAAAGPEFTLLESLAESVAQAVLRSFKVTRVRVRARKAKYSDEPSVGVEIERSRGRRSRL